MVHRPSCWFQKKQNKNKNTTQTTKNNQQQNAPLPSEPHTDRATYPGQSTSSSQFLSTPFPTPHFILPHPLFLHVNTGLVCAVMPPPPPVHPPPPPTCFPPPPSPPFIPHGAPFFCPSLDTQPQSAFTGPRPGCRIPTHTRTQTHTLSSPPPPLSAHVPHILHVTCFPPFASLRFGDAFSRLAPLPCYVGAMMLKQTGSEKGLRFGIALSLPVWCAAPLPTQFILVCA